MRIVGVIVVLFAAAVLRANTIFYDVNFNHDRLNHPPATGVGTNSPTETLNALQFSPAGLPIVIKSFDQLTNRPLLFTGGEIGGINFSLGRGTPDYTLDFDFETHDLTTNGYFEINPLFVLGGNGQMTTIDGQNFPLGWTDDQVHHLHMIIGAGSSTNNWSVQLDNDEPIVGTTTITIFDLRSIDFSIMANAEVGIDNIVIGTTTNFMPLKAFFSMSPTSGLGPEDRVVRDSAGNFYGTATFGNPLALHPGDYGSVFKTDAKGNLVWVFGFNNDNGANPSGGVIIGDDGFLYGTTQYPSGAVFKMSQNGELIWSVPFNYTNGPWVPRAGLTEVRNSKGEIELYGTTQYGGAYGGGTVFKLDASRKIQILHSFAGVGEVGAWPNRLVLGNDGFLYGTTAFDQTNGTIFKISPNGKIFTNLFFFDGTNGGVPMAGLTKYGKDAFYGTTYYGGTNFQGTLFRVTTAGVLTNLHIFGPSDNGLFSGPSENGLFPESELVLGRDGNFYGTTTSGGITNTETTYGNNLQGFGTVFRISPAGDFQKLADFHGGDGASPVGAMIEGQTGKFYGTALGFDQNENPDLGPGTIFCLSAMRPVLVIDPIDRHSVTIVPINQVELGITGRAKCDPPVTNIFYRLNDGNWFTAETTNGWSNWAGVVAPVSGTNLIQAYAVSAFGDGSRTNALRFRW